MSTHESTRPMNERTQPRESGLSAEQVAAALDKVVADHVAAAETYGEQGDHEGDAALARTADFFGAATQVAANDAGDASAGRAAWDAQKQGRAA